MAHDSNLDADRRGDGEQRRSEDRPIVDWRLDQLENIVQAFGPAVTNMVGIEHTLEGLVGDVTEIKTTHREFRIEVRQGLSANAQECRDEFTKLRDELRDDRRESRNRTMLALGPIALAALGIFAKVVLGLDLGVGQ